jgi:hypothetical protein
MIDLPRQLLDTIDSCDKLYPSTTTGLNTMIRYHDFTIKSAAEAFLDELRKRGALGYMITMNGAWHQVREIV